MREASTIHATFPMVCRVSWQMADSSHLSTTCPLLSALYQLRRERQHAVDLAQFAPEFPPGITTVITAVQIPIATPSYHSLRVVRLRMHRPHGGIGLYGQIQTLPGLAHVFGAHHRANTPRRAIANR